jgi:hypothetical protein
MISFGILTISFKRPKVLELFCASIKRLREELNMFIPCIVVGDAEHYEICSKYHIEHITMPNHPATAKWNRGVEYLMSIGVDYCVVMGSDDIASTNLAKNLITQMNSGIDLIGINTIYFVAGDGQYRGQMRKLIAERQILGVARTINREVIEKTGVLWNKESSWGMDGICLKNILPNVKTRAIVQGDCFDIKTLNQNEGRVQLNNFSFWMSKIQNAEDINIFYSAISEEEKQIFSEL